MKERKGGNNYKVIVVTQIKNVKNRMYYSNFLRESFLVDVIVIISVVYNFSLSCPPVLYVLFGVIRCLRSCIPVDCFYQSVPKNENDRQWAICTMTSFYD